MERKVKTTIFLPEDLWEKISIMAIKKRTSKNNIIINLLENSLREVDER